MTEGTTMPAEREAIAHFVKHEFGAAAVHLMLASGLPGGTRTQRTKNRAFADGFAKATSMIAKAIQDGDHLKESTHE